MDGNRSVEGGIWGKTLDVFQRLMLSTTVEVSVANFDDLTPEQYCKFEIGSLLCAIAPTSFPTSDVFGKKHGQEDGKREGGNKTKCRNTF